MISLLWVILSLPIIYAQQLLVIDLTSTTIQSRISTQICAGLLNRNSSQSGYYVYTLLNQPYDSLWLSDLTNITNPTLTSIPTFLNICLSNVNVKGIIRYNYTKQQVVVPNLITLGGVIDGILLEDNQLSPNNSGYPVIFDAEVIFDNFTEYDGTLYMYKNYVTMTSTLAFMNPGYGNMSSHPLHPPLINNLDPGLIDYIVQRRIFNFYLVDACIPSTDEYALMEEMLASNPWPSPIPVYGYDDTFPLLGGDTFEAETRCVRDQKKMGQIASTGVNNLSFYSVYNKLTSPLQQNPAPTVVYSPLKTYVALTIGDGDNIAYLKATRRDWMQQRTAKCQANPTYLGCFPLLWSISPHPYSFAPGLLQWYYNQSYLNKYDYFILPPSGDLYSYPAEMNAQDQSNYVSNTEQDCRLLDTSAVVAWEFVGTWENAITEYFPQYCKNTILRGIFPLNVPYNFPIPYFENTTTGELDFYKILCKQGKSGVVLFKPRSWRGTSYTGFPLPGNFKEYLTVEQMAAELNHYPRGTITQIYLTSDGGGNLDMLYDLVSLLKDHVQVVNHVALVDLALQRG